MSKKGNGKTEKCDHKGYWRKLGVSFISMPQKMIFVHNLFCKNCGHIKTETHTVKPPEKPPITRARMVPPEPLRPGIN